MYPSVNLLLAMLWLILAGCVFFWEWTHPDRPGLTIWDTGISIGWGLIFLSVYNLLRWSMARSYQARQRATAEAETRRRNELRKRSRPPEEMNPDLDFTDRPSLE